MKKLSLNPSKKVKAIIVMLSAIVLMVCGYFAISAGIVYANNLADTLAISRVRDRHLISKTVTIKEVPVITTMDIKGQVNAAIASNLK